MSQDGSWLRSKRRSLLGDGPHNCFFCKKKLEGRFEIHHIDEDHGNDEPSNLSAAHVSCHRSHHKRGNQNRLGHKHSAATRAKMSASHLRRNREKVA